MKSAGKAALTAASLTGLSTASPARLHDRTVKITVAYMGEASDESVAQDLSTASAREASQ
jgi:hypothetical protein